MPRSREENAARMREQREAEARGQEKVALQSEVMPEVKRSKRSNEDAVFPMNKRNAQRDVTRAAKQIVQEDAVFPTSNAERMKESYEPSSEAHGGSREHAGRPRELSRGQRDYENMVAVATKQSEAYAQRFERIAPTLRWHRFIHAASSVMVLRQQRFAGTLNRTLPVRAA